MFLLSGAEPRCVAEQATSGRVIQGGSVQGLVHLRVRFFTFLKVSAVSCAIWHDYRGLV